MSSKKKPISYEEWEQEQKKAWEWMEYPTKELPKRVSLDNPKVFIPPEQILDKDNEPYVPDEQFESILEVAEEMNPSIIAAIRGDLTVRELGRILNVSKSTAHNLIKKAKTHLQSLITH